jgi:hypothetical protein
VVQFGSSGPEIPGASVTALSPGMTTITATLCGQNASTTVYVPCSTSPGPFPQPGTDVNGQCPQGVSCCASAGTTDDTGQPTTTLGCGGASCAGLTANPPTAYLVCPESPCPSGTTCTLSVNSNTSVRYASPAVNVCDTSQVVSGGTCNTLVPPATQAAFNFFATTAPPPIGGTIVDGTYYLKELDDYTGVGGESGNPGTDGAQILTISQGTWKTANNDGQQTYYENAIVTTGGASSINITPMCGAANPIVFGTSYTATVTGELDLITVADATDTYVLVFEPLQQ